MTDTNTTDAGTTAPATVKRKAGESFESYAARVVAARLPVPEGERRYGRVYREQLTRRLLRELRDAEGKRTATAAKRKAAKAKAENAATKRSADRVDGYDRDDTGLSPDF